MSEPVFVLKSARRYLDRHNDIVRHTLSPGSECGCLECQLIRPLVELVEALSEAAPQVMCIAYDGEGRPSPTVQLMGDGEAVDAVVALKERAEKAEAIVRELEKEQSNVAQHARRSFKLWVATATASGYEPVCSWANFQAEVDHSALLSRLLDGKDPFPEPPPKRGGYPDYNLMEALQELREEQVG